MTGESPEDDGLAPLMQLYEAGRFAELQAAARGHLDIHPESAKAAHLLGLAHAQAGDLDAAARILDQVCAQAPDRTLAWEHAAAAHAGAGRPAEAAERYRRALSLDDTIGEVWNDFGLCLVELNDSAAAIAAFARAAELKPDFADAWVNLGNAQSALGDNEAACSAFTTARGLDRANVAAAFNLANALRRLRRIPEAEAAYRDVIVLQPMFATAHNNLGVTLSMVGRNDEALAAYRRAIELKADYGEAHANAGAVMRALGDYGGAERALRRAIDLAPNVANTHNSLGDLLKDLGELDAAQAGFARAVALEPDNLGFRSNQLFVQNYAARGERPDLLEDAKSFGALAASRARRFTSWPNDREGDRRLRIGLVSGDLRDHPVGRFLESTLEAVNPDAAELFVYANQRNDDELTERVRATAAQWRPVADLGDEALVELVRADAIDILVDLSGHTAHNRLGVFAWKPAPIQVTWLGYFATTGLEEIDYVVGDPIVAPSGEEKHFVETPWRLPDAYYCVTPPQEAPAPGPTPALSADRVTFGSFGVLAKINDDVLGAWARILNAVPTAQLVLKARPLGDEAVRERVAARFGTLGIPRERLTLEGFEARSDYFAAYNRIDIALDTFPYPGGATTVDALWMGTPVVTRRGDRFISHQGETLLTNAGLADWIADDTDGYVTMAVEAARDVDRLAALSTTLRPQLAASPLFDAKRFAPNLEDMWRTMWRRYVEGT